MTPDGSYDPLAPLEGFVARRSGSGRSTLQAAPSSTGRARTVAPITAPPFGTRDGGLVRYIVLLDVELDERVTSTLASGRSGQSFGQLAFTAITQRKHEMRAELHPDPHVRYSDLRTLRPRPIPPGTISDRRTSRLTPEQALAVHEIRQSLGRIELAQLHRLALDLYLART